MPDTTAVPAFTIASNNYLGMAKTFMDSYVAHHPGVRVWVCVVDLPSPEIDYAALPFEVIFASDLGIRGFQNFAFRYDILELNTAVKPFIMKYLRDKIGLDRVFYFDPDILVMDRLSILEQALDSNLAVLTPHLTGPLDNQCRPPERVVRMCGTYNLGFVGLRLNEDTREFLDWWCDRLFRYCINDLPNGLFVDQSWMDLAPAYLDSVAIVRDPIFNVAYWNLPQRFPVQTGANWTIDGQRVGFVHFSGLDVDDIDIISKHQDRIDLWSRPELRPLFEHYRDLIRASGQHELRDVEYAYHRFSNTEIDIPRSARKTVQEVDPEGRRWMDPFAGEGFDPFLAWLVRPVKVAGAWTSRAALSLWQSRDDLRAAFPDPLGGNAADLAGWFVYKGVREGGFHPSLVEDLRQKLRRHSPGSPDQMAEVDLGDPGDWIGELNEPAGVDFRVRPVVTRLAMEIYHRRPEVQRLYPDPLGADRRDFAYWFVLCARETEGLHPDLVRPVRDSLPIRTRAALAMKRIPTDGRSDVNRTLNLSKTADSQRPSTESRPSWIDLSVSETAGVNLVGYFHGERGATSFAPVVRERMVAAGVPLAEIERDHCLPELMTTDSIRYPHGAPFPMTVLLLRSAEWKEAVEALPITMRAGGTVVGFVTDAVDFLDHAALSAVDELWTPSSAAAQQLGARTDLVVRTVAVEPPDWTSRTNVNPPQLGNGKIWLAVTGEVHDQRLSPGASNALEVLRRVNPEAQERLGVCLISGAGSDRLKAELRHLPVHVVPMPALPGVLRTILDSCHGWLNLDPASELAPIHLLCEACGKPVIGLAPGGLTDVWTGKWTISPSPDVIGRAAKLLNGLARLNPSEALKAGGVSLIDADSAETAASWRAAIQTAAVK